DEAYLIGRGKRPVEAYLGIEEILDVALASGAEAIHPGYGFLSENGDFAEACQRRGVRFIGPRPSVVRLMGDKVAAKALAQKVGVPVVPGITLEGPEQEVVRAARAFHAKNGPVLVKAAHGGGGRGMRVVREAGDMEGAIAAARSESKLAFGSPAVFLEKYLDRVRHIEVQILGDQHGNVVHVHERDCSVQRRYQKLIEIAPAPNLPDRVRRKLFDAALTLMRAAEYSNAGTVEFLVEAEKIYFIEVNARLQVEHTITEQITGIDLVQAQLRVAEGHQLSDPEIGIADQSSIVPRGSAIQLRVTTEDPANNFLPDAGSILAWRPATGFGIRLDGGNGYPNAHISRFYDSLLVKIIAYAPSFEGAIQKGLRALREFRIRGVKTNLAFLENVLGTETFRKGETFTRWVDDAPELFAPERRRDRATKLLQYLGEVIVNGHPTIKAEQRRCSVEFAPPRLPPVPPGPPLPGTRQILEERGAEGLAAWVGRPIRKDEAISAALYPRVMADYFDRLGKYEDVSILDTPTYLYGLEVGQEIFVELEPGKTLVVELSAVGLPDEKGMRTVYFELNGHARQVSVHDRSRAVAAAEARKAERGNPEHVGASMPGTVVALHTKAGDKVEAGAPLLTLEAMKMETVVRAPR
ncbi:MAG: ATP-binding protein, partial [Myxococcaceae bacterium]